MAHSPVGVHLVKGIHQPQIRKGAPKHMLVTTVSLPVLKNCEALEKDDVLTVQYAEDEEEC